MKLGLSTTRTSLYFDATEAQLLSEHLGLGEGSKVALMNKPDGTGLVLFKAISNDGAALSRSKKSGESVIHREFCNFLPTEAKERRLFGKTPVEKWSLVEWRFDSSNVQPVLELTYPPLATRRTLKEQDVKRQVIIEPLQQQPAREHQPQYRPAFKPSDLMPKGAAKPSAPAAPSTPAPAPASVSVDVDGNKVTQLLCHINEVNRLSAELNATLRIRSDKRLGVAF